MDARTFANLMWDEEFDGEIEFPDVRVVPNMLDAMEEDMVDEFGSGDEYVNQLFQYNPR